MILKSKINLRSLLNGIILLLFFTLPMAILPFLALVRNTPNLLSFLTIGFFTLPIGLMPIHLLIDGFLSIRFTEDKIIIKKYFGFWVRRYSYNDLKSYSKSSYQRAKGSSKRYSFMSVLFSDGKAYRIDQWNFRNYDDIYKQFFQKGALKEDEKLIHDDKGLYIWLFYILTAFTGTGVMLLILKLKNL